MIGTCYYKRKIYKVAIACKNKALNLYSNVFEDQYQIASIIKDIAINYDCLNDINNSIAYYLKAIIRYARLGDYIEVARIYSTVALCYESLELFEKGLKAATLAINGAKGSSIPLALMGELEYVLGICNYNINDLKIANKCFRNALDDIRASGQQNNEAINAITEMLSVCNDENYSKT